MLFPLKLVCSILTIKFSNDSIFHTPDILFADTTVPTGFMTTGPPRRTNRPRATFGWRSSEDAKYECYLDNQADPIDCGEGTAGQFSTDALPDGRHSFSVVATDDLGNSAPIVNSTWTIGMSQHG